MRYKMLLILWGLILFWIFYSSSHVLANHLNIKNGDLVMGGDKKIYVIENNFKRYIVSMEVFRKIGYKIQNVMKVKDAILLTFPEGPAIENPDVVPDGTLIKGYDKKVYLIEGGKKRWIVDQKVFKAKGFNQRKIIVLPDFRVGPIPETDPLTLIEKPADYPDTVITEAPQGEIMETNVVRISYQGRGISQNQLFSFSTYISEIDRDWSSFSFSNSRIVTLPSGPGTYTFYVKAQNSQGRVDPIPAKITFKVLISNYFGKIRLSESGAMSSIPESEQITISNFTETPVNITGFTLENKKTKSKYKIPQGQNLVIVAAPNIVGDIILQKRERALVISGTNPLGVSFRPNKCIGYLSKIGEFRPSLSFSCPRPNLREIESLTLECKIYLNRFSSCETPPHRDPKVGEREDPLCNPFIDENLNYQGCVRNYVRDSDFLSDEWRVYFGFREPIWDDQEEVITLRDESGLFIDKISYSIF